MSAMDSSLPPLPDLAALPAMDITARADRLRTGFDSAGIDALVVTNLVDVRYLTGFTGSAALLLVAADGLTFVTDGRYAEQSAAQLADAGVSATIEVSNTEQRQLLATAAEGITRLGLQADSVTWAQQRRYATEWFPTAELIATEGMVEQLRIVKDDGELARMEAAAVVADHALAAVRSLLGQGVTEAGFALALDTEIRRLGAEGNSFETIVASGPNGAKPHARPGQRHIGEGDLVVIDFGAIIDGYCSDMTRTIGVGELSATQARMLHVVGDAQRRGVEAVRAGVEAAAVDQICRDVITEAGWADAFIHGTGHGVGLDIHEAPRVSATSTATLEAGFVVTVEPGVYLPEHGGVRIEDTVVVTTDGCRPLTHTPKHTTV
jgi:Xaa-Pro aminopeptidase